jgi:PAS domain S-box-containing protein
MDFLKSTAELAGHITVICVFLASLWALAKRPWRAVSTAMTQVDTMAKALGPNGGASLADEIRKQGVEQTKQGIAQIRTAVAVDALCDVIEKSIFQTDAQGHWLRVNRTFAAVFGYTPMDVMGMGWVACIHHEDRDGFLQEWKFAIADRRPFRRAVRMVTRAGTTHAVIVHANPTLGNPDIHLGWFGTVEMVSARAEGQEG